MSNIENMLQLEIEFNISNYEVMFTTIKNIRDMLNSEVKKIDIYMKEIDKACNNSINWIVISKSIDDFFNTRNQTMQNKMFDEKAKKLAMKNSMNDIISNIAELSQNEPEKMEVAKNLGKQIEEKMKK